MDFEAEVTLRIPQHNTFDSDKGYYYTKVSEKTKRDNYFRIESEDGYEYSYGDTKWK